MAHHIFLTGKKHIGKSTLLKKTLDRYSGTIGGFFTIRTNTFLKDAYTVHMICAGENVAMDKSNLLFVCGEHNGHISERFDDLGCMALDKCSNCSLIVMDELGPHEAEATRFRKKVLTLLEGDVPILGVLQTPAELLWPEITNHPNVELIEITEYNREQEEINL